MAIYGLITDKNKSVDDFILKMQDKIEKPDLLENPFVGFIKKEDKNNESFIFVYLNLIWYNPVYVALILTGVLLVAYKFTFHWVMFFILPLYMGAFMFTKLFNKLAFYFSLRKNGYKGKIRFLKETELLLRLANWQRPKI